MFELDKEKNIYTTIKPIESVTQYIQALNQVDECIGNVHHWFRGVKNSSFKLEPTEVRKNNWQYDAGRESEFIHDFVQRAKGIVLEQHDDWSWYTICQHYGLPTRLLDWSESALTSLFFALEDNDDSNNASVWVMDAWELNNLSVGKVKVYSTDASSPDSDDTQTIERYRFGSKVLPKYPIAVQPPHTDKRISAQRGCFTIHGKAKNSFEELSLNASSPFLARIDIAAAEKVEIRRELHKLGIDNFSIYPDLEGLAKAVRWHYENNVVYI